MKNTQKRLNSGDMVFDIINHSLLFITLILAVIPLWFVIVASLSDPNAVNRGDVMFWFKDFNIVGYEKVFKEDAIWMGYFNTIIYSVFGMGVTLFLTMPFSYALSHKDFAFTRLLTILLLITWYFHGGLIPTFLLVKSLGLYDSRAVIIILGSLTVWNVVISRTYFKNTIPDELWEACLIEGGGHVQYFGRIVLPLSKVIIVVIMLFSMVAQWNDFFKSLIYLSSPEKSSLQLVLRQILISAQNSGSLLESLEDSEAAMEKERLAQVIKYCVIILGALPLLIVYPFFQKYFIQGVMIGSVKG
jgi:putative aldouronate transport system permease protein